MTEPTKRDVIVARIRAAMALSKDRAATLAEAEAAAEMATKLMLKYAIEQAEVDASNPEAQQKIDCTTVVIERVREWTLMLGHAVEEMYGVVMTFIPGSTCHDFWGRAVNRELAEATFCQLITRLKLAERRMGVRNLGKVMAKNDVAKYSWLLGASRAILAKVYRTKEAERQNPEAGARAVMVIEDEHNRVAAWVEQNFKPKEIAESRARIDGEAYARGVRYGQAMDVRPMLKA